MASSLCSVVTPTRTNGSTSMPETPTWQSTSVFIDVPNMIEKFGFSVSNALEVGTQIHTAPEAFGKVMSRVKPRMAIAYHFFNDPDTAPPILEGIRSTYDGPLSLAEDYMVWNVTKEDIRVRNGGHQ